MKESTYQLNNEDFVRLIYHKIFLDIERIEKGNLNSVEIFILKDKIYVILSELSAMTSSEELKDIYLRFMCDITLNEFSEFKRFLKQ